MNDTLSMSSESFAIQFDHVSKYYSDTIGLLRYKNKLDRIKNGQFFSKVAVKKPFYALKDVSFTVNKREKVGFIGRNGAGKSTTLKLIGGISTPNEGAVIVNGRIGGVLELGSGFNGEMTARDNIYLQGSMYGYSEEQMSEMIPEIMAIADLNAFLDVQLKKYSSGMKVRLGFAVALTASPDIVLLDEVMAVGDAAFRKRSLDLMEQFLENKTVFFVSHSMNEIKRVCQRVIVLDQGSIVFDGSVQDGVEFYNASIETGGENLEERQVVQGSNLKRGRETKPLYRIKNLGFDPKGKDREHSCVAGDAITTYLLVNADRFLPLKLNILFSKVMLNNLTTLLQSESISLGEIDGDKSLEYTLPTDRLTEGLYRLSFSLRIRKKKSKDLVVVENVYIRLTVPAVITSPNERKVIKKGLLNLDSILLIK